VYGIVWIGRRGGGAHWREDDGSSGDGFDGVGDDEIAGSIASANE